MAKMSVPADFDVAVFSGNNGNFNKAVFYFLGRDVGKSDKIALPTKVLGEFAGQSA